MGGGGMSSGSRIGRKSKNSTSSQDTGHCNSLEITVSAIKSIGDPNDQQKWLLLIKIEMLGYRIGNYGQTSEDSSENTFYPDIVVLSCVNYNYLY